MYLMELTGANNMEEVHNIIMADWKNFNETCDGEYRNYVGQFSTFLDDYHDNLDKLMELNRQTIELLDPKEYLDSNDLVIKPEPPEINLDNTVAEWTAEDLAIIRAAQRAWQLANKIGDKAAMEQAHAIAEQIRAKYGYSGGFDGSEFLPFADNAVYLENINETNALNSYKINSLNSANSGIEKAYNSNVKTEASYNNQLKNQFAQRENNWNTTTTNVANTQAKDNKNFNNYVNTDRSILYSHDNNTTYQVQINDQIVRDWINLNADNKAAWDAENGNFDSFVNKYRDKLQEYAQMVDELKRLQQMANNSMSGSGNIGGNPDDLFKPGTDSGNTGSGNTGPGNTGNNNGNTGNNSGNIGGGSSLPNPADEIAYIRQFSESDATALSMYQELWQKYKTQQQATSDPAVIASLQKQMDAAHKYANEIRVKYGLPTYARGIDNGPVTYTGLAMLHGTPSEPEYVLNSAQASNLLYNMAHSRLPEFTSNVTNNSTPINSYVLNGDIVIDGASDPREFWSNVTKSMNNRSVVTKNK